MAKLLLVEDDEILGATITENLSLEGHSVEWIREGTLGLEAGRKKAYDLLILDVMLPGLNGLDILKDIRLTSKVPTIIISAKGSSQDRIAGLELSADDYLPKPFHFKELNLRVQALLRRSSSGSAQIAENLKLGLAEFDFGSLTVILTDGTKEVLTEKEAGILRLLVSQANMVVSRETILNTVWGHDNYPSSRTVDNFIVKLRKWIEPNVQKPVWITSHRGIGYCLRLKA